MASMGPAQRRRSSQRGGRGVPSRTRVSPAGDGGSSFSCALLCATNTHQLGATMAVTPRSVKAKNKRASSAKKSPKLSKSSRPTKQSSALSKRRAKSLTLAKPGDAQKTKPASIDKKKKRRVYTEAELNIPKLNGIVPIGVQKSKGQKKGKKFVDDQESMMAILNVVKADKEGHIESKVQKARQLEEIRTAKKAEHEAKAKERSELVSIAV